MVPIFLFALGLLKVPVKYITYANENTQKMVEFKHCRRSLNTANE